MAEALVSVLLEQLTSILYEEARQEVRLVTGVGKEIDKLKSNFESIRALLDDAEEKQIKERSIKLWLERLKEVCYDIEDVLDEWSTSLLKKQIEEADQNSASRPKGKVCCPLIPCFSAGKVVRRRDIALKVKEMNERLDDIAKEKDRYQLASRDINRHTRRVETTAFAEVSKLHGRDDVKKQIVNSLVCGSSTEEEASDVKTISVVGMGGIGKTALAQLIYDDADVKTHFNVRIWVCVAEDFEKNKIAKAMLQSLDPKLAQNPDSLTLQNLLERICRCIEGKKVLLVLDDVWTDENNSWKALKRVLATAAAGSRILVTTRKATVAEAVKSFRVFHLEDLSHDVCWKILCEEAFAGRADREQFKSLEGTGRKIAKKCRGLPLTAKTLGGMLRSKKKKEDWERVLNSEMWRLDLVKEEVFAPLLLSYYDLPSAIRRCFLYCSVFPKNHLLERNNIIYEWMAQGYLSCDDDREMEEVGAEYFECLVERSFFQDFVKREDGSVRACKMHDVVVDFARFIMHNEFLSKKVSVENSHWEIRARHLLVTGGEGEGKFLSKKVSEENDPWVIRMRHLLVTRDEDDDDDDDDDNEDDDDDDEDDDDEGSPQFSMSFGADNKLRSLVICEFDAKNIVQDLQNLCIHSKYLRSLHFLCGYWLPVFPEEVGKLMHLRLLNLSGSKLEELPETICELCNLQSLYLQNCYKLRKLPKKMEKLINLRCLDTTDSALIYYPKWIGRLTSLRELRGIGVICDRNDDAEFSLGDVGNFCHIRSLMLIIRGYKVDVDEARRANLQRKVHLKDLALDLGISSALNLRDDVIEVLHPLPHVNVISVSTSTTKLLRVLEHARAIHAAYLYRRGAAERIHGENV